MQEQAVRRGAGAGSHRPKYRLPSPPATIRLVDLLADARTVAPDQQPRLGFESHPRGPELYCVGQLSLVRMPAVAIVGARKVSDDGRKRARKLARELVAAGVVVVSGLAEGVDAAAHESAIEAGGRTIAVIGTPVDKAYPAAHGALQERIAREHLLISQFPIGAATYPSNFPTRNKLMAALSDATVIIEASDTSGSLHQAAECVRLRRWLFIAKSVADNPELKWPASFLKERNTRVLAATQDLVDALQTAP